MTLSPLELRRALEALRSGVPSRDAVKALGASNTEAEGRFHSLLKGGHSGLMLSGGFGSGKSHLLEYFEHQALSTNFVVSRVVISKETPLYDLGKVFRAAADSAVVPGRNGQAIQEIAHAIRPNTDRYAHFYQWANAPDVGLAALFPATLMLHERLNNDPELVEEITNFWAGERIAVAKVRNGLRQIGAGKMYVIKPATAKLLAPQRFAFITALIKAAGYAGWVVLIDEVELIGRYTPLQRGRSYAEIARWLESSSSVDSLEPVAVLAITDDFALAVLDGKGDRDSMVSRLIHKEPENVVEAARRGMHLIERGTLDLQPPSDTLLSNTYLCLKVIHCKAHSWSPPDLESSVRTIQRPMRSYVRRWINEWDLRRLHPEAAVEMVDDELNVSYETDEDLEVDLTEGNE